MDFEKILQYAVDNKASDIHISPDIPVFFRIHGTMASVGEPVTIGDIQNLALNILAPKQQENLETKRHVDFVYSSKSGYRFRGNAYHTREGLVIALRIIPNDVPDFHTLGVPDFVLQHAMGLPHGLVLVVGPTGNGKSTTLASMLKHRSQTKAEHIITMEDPIEFLMPSARSIVHQRALGRDVNDFSTGLKAALREDPDVLMVGEMRDLETVSAALTAAETGHLVFSTLHTNNAAETINRIIDAFPSDQQAQVRAQLSATLSMVIAQKLLPREDQPGRVLACEVMVANYAIRNHIRQNTVYQVPNAMQTDNSGEMILFDHSLAQLVVEGKISQKSAFENAISPEQVNYVLELNGMGAQDEAEFSVLQEA